MFLIYTWTPTYTENTWLWNLSISTNSIFQVSEIRWQELLNLYPAIMAAVTTVDTILADDSVTTVKILDLNVTTWKIADDAVTNVKLANMTRGTVKVGWASDAPTDLDANDDWKILIWDWTDLNSVAVSWDITITNAWVTAIWANKVLSSMISSWVLKVATITFTTAELLQWNTTPKELVAAPAVWSYIVVDRITVSVDYVSAAYATNTTLEFRYTNWSWTKVTADVAAILNTTADKVVSVWWLAAETVITPAAAVVALVATWNPITWNSDVKITVQYRILSI